MTGRGEAQPESRGREWERGYSYSRQAGGKRGRDPGLNPFGFREKAAASVPAAPGCCRAEPKENPCRENPIRGRWLSGEGGREARSSPQIKGDYTQN